MAFPLRLAILSCASDHRYERDFSGAELSGRWIRSLIRMVQTRGLSTFPQDWSGISATGSNAFETI